MSAKRATVITIATILAFILITIGISSVGTKGKAYNCHRWLRYFLPDALESPRV